MQRFYPPDSLLIAYIAIAQGGLGLMDAHTRAVPNFVLTMSQAIRHAEKGFSSSKTEPTYHLPATLCDIFRLTKNTTSSFLRTFYQLLPEVEFAGTHAKCTDPMAFFIEHSSFSSARNRIKKRSAETESNYHRSALRAHTRRRCAVFFGASEPAGFTKTGSKRTARKNDVATQI